MHERRTNEAFQIRPLSARAGGKLPSQHLEAVLDEAIEETFPASDPIAVIVEVAVSEAPPEPEIAIRRAYDPPAAEDGTRVLVDRLWPRGLDKKKARIDAWLKDLAPSPELRAWFKHEPEKWEAFKQRYWQELRENPAALTPLLELMRKGRVSLLFGSKETRFNNAAALKEYLLEASDSRSGDAI